MAEEWDGKLWNIRTFYGGDKLFLGGNTKAGNLGVKYSKFHRQLNKPARATYLEILMEREFLLVGLCHLFIGFSVLIPFTFITTYAVQELTFRYDVASRLVTIIGMASLVEKLVLGSLSDVVGRIKAIICRIMIAIGSLGVICSLKLFCHTIFYGLLRFWSWSYLALERSLRTRLFFQKFYQVIVDL